MEERGASRCLCAPRRPNFGQRSLHGGGGPLAVSARPECRTLSSAPYSEEGARPRGKTLGSAYKEEGEHLSLPRRALAAKLWFLAGRRGAPPAASARPDGQIGQRPLQGGRVRLLLLRHTPTAKLWAAPPKGRGVRLAASARPRGQTLGSAPYREEGASARPGGQTWGSAPYAVLV